MDSAPLHGNAGLLRRSARWIRHLTYVVGISYSLGMAICALPDVRLPLDYVRAFIGAGGAFALGWGTLRLIGWVIDEFVRYCQVAGINSKMSGHGGHRD